MDLSNKILKHVNGDVIKTVKRLHGFNKRETEFYITILIKENGEVLEDFVFPCDVIHLMYVYQELTIEGEFYE